MIIQADAEAKQAVVQLCDIALKVGGLQNMKSVNQVLASVRNYVPEDASAKKEKK